MATLIFDIETVGETWSDLDEVTQQSLTRWIDKTARSEEEHVALLEDVQNGLGFSPLTGRVVAIGLYDLERQQGVVYYVGASDEADRSFGDFQFKSRTEAEMLEDFWEGVKSYDTFVTFNGRRFDVPFLTHRSLVHDITPTKNLMEGRYLYQQKSVQHIDLLDQLTFYGAMNRRPSLHLFCRAFGIESPKADVSGDDVTELFQKKKFRDIAEYNMKDVVATTVLYKKWQRHLAPINYENHQSDSLIV